MSHIMNKYKNTGHKNKLLGKFHTYVIISPEKKRDGYALLSILAN